MQQPEHRQRCFRRGATEATLLDVEIWKPRYRDLPCRSPPMRLYRSSGKHIKTDKDHTYNVSSTAHIHAHHFFIFFLSRDPSLSLSRSRSRCLSYCAFTSPPQKKKDISAADCQLKGLAAWVCAPGRLPRRAASRADGSLVYASQFLQVDHPHGWKKWTENGNALMCPGNHTARCTPRCNLRRRAWLRKRMSPFESRSEQEEVQRLTTSPGGFHED